tara:strand:- start:29320 stop:29718 length:399 start_codon:yes stop_codon:yes gene_type:complete
MTTKAINTRDDVFLLVDTFYRKIRKDELLGPIFNNQISDWDAHLQRLTDFWETNLFATQSFKGNPFLKHQLVDAKNNYEIGAFHFGIWLQYWFATVDALFVGDRAELAKHRARKMGTFMHLNMAEKKPKITN